MQPIYVFVPVCAYLCHSVLWHYYVRYPKNQNTTSTSCLRLVKLRARIFVTFSYYRPELRYRIRRVQPQVTAGPGAQ